MMEKLVAIDTHVVIWGIKRRATAGQESMVGKTTDFLNWLWNNHFEVLIPAPVIGEVLAPVPVAEHGIILSQIDRALQIVPYDLAAAAKFAEMVGHYRQSKELKDYKEDHAIPREAVKIDYMIAAIAVSRNARVLYSEDKHLTKFASSFIDVKCVPDVGKQATLFSPLES